MFPPYEEEVKRDKKREMISAHSNALNWLSEAEKPHCLIVHQSLRVRTMEWRCNQKSMHGRKVQLLMEPRKTWPATFKKSFKNLIKMVDLAHQPTALF